MTTEMKGQVIEINDDFGYIKGEDNNNYVFIQSNDVIYKDGISINDTVIFKPIYFKNLNMYKATLIEKSH